MNEDRIYDMLSELTGIATYDVCLRDHPKAYKAVRAAVDAEIAQLKAERDALLKDAERYRWLRDKAPGEIVFDHTRDQRDGGNHFALHVPFDGREIPDDEASGRALDEAIDAAMASSSKEGK